MEAHSSTTGAPADVSKNCFYPDNDVDQLHLTHEALLEDNQQLKKEVDELRTQLEQYKLVSQSFEKRVLDLQMELKKKDEEISSLKETECTPLQTTNNHVRDDASCRQKDHNAELDESEPEQFRKLFIGGLSYSTTDDSLRGYFSKFGDLVDCVVMKDTASKRSRGFGFVVYSRVSMVDAAQAARPHIVDGREVETKRAVPKGEPLHHENQLRVKKIFVGGLKDTTDEEVLKEYFSQFGRVDLVDLIEDRQTKRLRGFAYVTFNDYDPVDKAVLQKYHTIDGRRCEVKKALSKMEMRNLKSDVILPLQGNIWPTGGHCGPNSSSGNMCHGGRNVLPNCNVAGFAGCSGMRGFNGPQGPHMETYNGNMAHGAWSQCGGWNQCNGGVPWCGDGYHVWRGHEPRASGSYNASYNGRCSDSSFRGSGFRGGDGSLQYRGGGGTQRNSSPNGFVPD